MPRMGAGYAQFPMADSARPSLPRTARPALWVVRRVEAYGGTWLYPWAAGTIWVLFVCASIWLERGSGWLSVVFFAAASLLVGSSQYVQWARRISTDQLRRSAESALSQAESDVWETVRRLNTDAMGHLSVLASLIRQRRESPREMSPRQFALSLQSLQQHLLTHIINVLQVQLELDDARTLSANWCLLDADNRTFSVRVYDRNMPNRQPTPRRKHSVAPGMPGASEAFLSREVCVVKDTADYPEAFPDNPPYRSILSLPVVTADIVVGVVNVDASVPGILDTDLQHFVQDAAYIIGVCEVLRIDGQRNKTDETGREGGSGGDSETVS